MLAFLLIGLVVGAGVDLYRRQRGERWVDPQLLAARDSLRREFVARANEGLPQVGQPSSDSAAHQPETKTLVPSRPGLVNINRASASELERLPHIGPSLAGRIVAHRERHGPFRRIEDLRQVNGIAEKTLARIRPYLTID